MTELEDALVEAALREPDAFAELIRRHQDGLVNFLYRMTGNREDAEDLAQEAFLRAYRALPRFRIGSPFRPWLYKIASNLALNHFSARRATSPLVEEIVATSPMNSPEAMAELREVQAQLREAILELPESYRVILLLRHLNELSYEEIAAVLGVPIGTAKVRLHRARKMVQEKLQERLPDRGKHGSHELRDGAKPASAVS